MHWIRKFDDIHVKSSNETQVSRTTLQCLPEIVVLVDVGVDDCPVGKNDFEVLDVVAGPSVRSREERIAATSDAGTLEISHWKMMSLTPEPSPAGSVSLPRVNSFLPSWNNLSWDNSLWDGPPWMPYLGFLKEGQKRKETKLVGRERQDNGSLTSHRYQHLLLDHQ